MPPNVNNHASPTLAVTHIASDGPTPRTPLLIYCPQMLRPRCASIAAPEGNFPAPARSLQLSLSHLSQYTHSTPWTSSAHPGPHSTHPSIIAHGTLSI
ncbi:hypothetical protein PILCRDRAFT_1144 [Piloderma croceum F 1598]|uniref:Uncharacterized protein n=1 Tax=Piloderma croceum (strain F 1598) TaxID=765440 RepID=A0A0C3GGY2_PILCF|nr:hypothetical protein PILCRDRAFT_1144 [Piloderma croceum F 1598]